MKTPVVVVFILQGIWWAMLFLMIYSTIKLRRLGRQLDEKRKELDDLILAHLQTEVAKLHPKDDGVRH